MKWKKGLGSTNENIQLAIEVRNRPGNKIPNIAIRRRCVSDILSDAQTEIGISLERKRRRNMSMIQDIRYTVGAIRTHIKHTHVWKFTEL